MVEVSRAMVLVMCDNGHWCGIKYAASGRQGWSQATNKKSGRHGEAESSLLGLIIPGKSPEVLEKGNRKIAIN